MGGHVDGLHMVERHQLGSNDSKVVIWAGIIGNELMGPFKVEDGVKIDSAGYSQFLEKNLMPWMKKKSAAFKKKMVFMQDNVPPHASKFTREWLAKKGINEDHLMTWPPASPDLDPIENYWSLLKRNSMLAENNTHPRRACGMRW